MRNLKSGILLFWALIPLLCIGEETGIKFSIGPIYRDFGDVDFKDSAFRNFGNESSAQGPYGIQGYRGLRLPPVLSNTNFPIVVDYVKANKSKDNIDTGSLWGPMLGMEFDIADEVEYIVSFVANFQFFSIQADNHNNNNFSFFSLEQNSVPNTNNPVIHIVQPGNAANLISEAGQPSRITDLGVDNDFDLELYVFDAGLKISLATLDPLRIGIAAGPTLSIGDVDTRQSERASFIRADNPLSEESYSTRRSKSDVDFVVGLYTALEAAYRFTETFSFGMGFRYDFNSVEVGTSLAEMDLETVGGYARFILDF